MYAELGALGAYNYRNNGNYDNKRRFNPTPVVVVVSVIVPSVFVSSKNRRQVQSRVAGCMLHVGTCTVAQCPYVHIYSCLFGHDVDTACYYYTMVNGYYYSILTFPLLPRCMYMYSTQHTATAAGFGFDFAGPGLGPGSWPGTLPLYLSM